MEKILCGVDMGGTKLAIGLVEQNGRVMDKAILYDHVEKTEQEVIGSVSAIIKEMLSKHGLGEGDLLGIGFGYPGHIRSREGITITSSNLKNFKNFPVRAEFAKHFDTRIVTDTDAKAQAFAEYKFGAGVGYEDLIFLTISSGIGAGIILNGRILRGMTGTAGEVGHTIVNPASKVRCGCGNYGCLMSQGCGICLSDIIKEKLKKGKHLSSCFDNDIKKVCGETVKNGLDADDELCREVVLECAEYNGIGVYNLFQIFNPPIVILGGGLMNWGDVFMNRIKEKFYSLAKNMLYDEIVITRSKLEEDAALIGAAALLLEKQNGKSV